MVLLGLPLLLLVAFVPSFIRMFSLVLAFALLFFARAAARVLDPLPLKIENQVEQNKLTSFFLSSLSDFLQALLYNLYNFLESNSVNLETKYHKLLQKRNKRKPHYGAIRNKPSPFFDFFWIAILAQTVTDLFTDLDETQSSVIDLFSFRKRLIWIIQSLQSFLDWPHFFFTL
jgi:hypothetical protein